MTIGALSKSAGISEYTLRYYEKKGLIRVERDSSGRRCYADSDIAWVEFLQRLKDTGMMLKDITKYADLRYEGNKTMPERLAMLRSHREYVLEQQARWAGYLQNLDDKINFYKSAIEKVSKKSEE